MIKMICPRCGKDLEKVEDSEIYFFVCKNCSYISDYKIKTIFYGMDDDSKQSNEIRKSTKSYKIMIILGYLGSVITLAFTLGKYDPIGYQILLLLSIAPQLIIYLFKIMRDD